LVIKNKLYKFDAEKIHNIEQKYFKQTYTIMAITITPLQASISAQGGEERQFTVVTTSDIDYIYSDATWITGFPSSLAEGSYTVTVNIAQHTGREVRTGVITFKNSGQTVATYTLRQILERTFGSGVFNGGNPVPADGGVYYLEGKTNAGSIIVSFVLPWISIGTPQFRITDSDPWSAMLNGGQSIGYDNLTFWHAPADIGAIQEYRYRVPFFVNVNNAYNTREVIPQIIFLFEYDGSRATADVAYDVPILQERKYSYTRNADGGTLSGGSSTGPYARGSVVTLPTSATKSGYGFVGFTSSAWSGIKGLGDTFTMPAQNTAVTANWVAMPALNHYIYSTDEGATWTDVETTEDTVNVMSGHITNLILNLPNLIYLVCAYNPLLSLDLSGAPNLQIIFGEGDYNLKYLDVSYLQYLTSLDCENCKLTAIKVDGLSNLKVLNCQNNSLTSLNLSGLTSLETLDCDINSLTSLNLSGLTSLKTLECDNNSITSLNLSGLINLERLECDKNKLSSLDLSGLSNLTNVDCDTNDFTSLNISNFANLRVFSCENCDKLTSLSMSNLPNLTNLECYNCANLPSIDLSGSPTLYALKCENCSNLREIRLNIENPDVSMYSIIPYTTGLPGGTIYVSAATVAASHPGYNDFVSRVTAAGYNVVVV
jgi:Leucine-rich repeat (LRR) protein